MNSQHKHAYVAVVLGLRTNGLGNVRALCRQGVPVIIFLSREQASEVYAASRYGQQEIVDVKDGDAIVAHLDALPKEKTYILFPTTDYQVSYLSEHRENLPANCLLAFPEKNVVHTLMDKEKFDRFCRTHQFLVPNTALIHNDAELKKASSTLSFPIIAKTPTKAYKPGVKKAYIHQNDTELDAWYSSIQALHHEFVLQEYIPGMDRSVYFVLQYISAKGKLLASFTGRKIRQWPPLKGGTASAEPAYNEFLTEHSYEFFKKAGFSGIGSMEYKRDPRTGKFYMIEPTVCRTDFQEGVAIVNKVNIPWVAYQDIRGEGVAPQFQKKKARKSWMHVQHDRLARDWYIAQKKMTYWGWLSSLRHIRAFDAFALQDPGPLISIIRHKIVNRIHAIRT